MSARADASAARTGWGIAVAGHPPEDPIGVMGFVVGEVGSATLGVARTP
jgi:hypothetical protein